MNSFTLAWIGLALAGGIIELVALFNSRRGDTLSEHLWAWLGVRRPAFVHPPVGSTWPAAGPFPRETTPGVHTPVWTLRVARMAFLTALMWFVLHIATGGWV